MSNSDPQKAGHWKLPDDPDDRLKVNLIILIGRLTVEWANLESWFIKLLAELLIVDMYRAEVVFHSVPGARARRTMLDRLFKVFVPDHGDRDKFEKLLHGFKKCTDARNHFVHAQYDFTAKPHHVAVYGFPSKFDGKNYVQNLPVNAAMLNEVRQAISRCEKLQAEVFSLAETVRPKVSKTPAEQSHTHALRPMPPSTRPPGRRTG
jgi:hypothetical protein